MEVLEADALVIEQPTFSQKARHFLGRVGFASVTLLGGVSGAVIESAGYPIPASAEAFDQSYFAGYEMLSGNPQQANIDEIIGDMNVISSDGPIAESVALESLDGADILQLVTGSGGGCEVQNTETLSDGQVLSATEQNGNVYESIPGVNCAVGDNVVFAILNNYYGPNVSRIFVDDETTGQIYDNQISTPYTENGNMYASFFLEAGFTNQVPTEFSPANFNVYIGINGYIFGGGAAVSTTELAFFNLFEPGLLDPINTLQDVVPGTTVSEVDSSNNLVTISS